MKTILSMYKHLSWSNQQILEALQKEDNQRARQIFSHILLTEKLWIARLNGLDSSQISIWTDADIKTCKTLIEENEQNITIFLGKLTISDLDHIISYKNSKGIEFQSSIRDILTHIALHGQYHRGQINLQLRSDGMEPITTDYIMFVR